MRILRFRGGVHPSDRKSTAALSTVTVPPPARMSVLLSQHVGAPARATVKKGDRVLAWQVIGEPGGFISARIHSPVSGTVVEVGEAPHPLGRSFPAVIIDNDGQDERVEVAPVGEDASPEAIREAIAQAGIVGMGGAGFPTHVKLSPPPDFKIDTVLLNGAECEPMISADHRLMLQWADEVVGGLRILMRALGVTRGFIGVEDNKVDAIKQFQRILASEPGVDVVPLHVRYPQGAEKQLIYACTGRVVPAAGLPMAVGCVVQNVATARAVYRAVNMGEPLVGRVATVTGGAVIKPGNVEFRVGTPIGALIEACGGMRENARKIILGGPMMGLAQETTAIPATKATNGVLVLTDAEAVPRSEQVCIRCGSCHRACPMSLMPLMLAQAVKTRRSGEAERLGATDCIECGCCGYVCPSSIPLVQYIRQAKADIAAARKKAV